MFFNRQTTLIFITRGKIRAAVFSSRGKITKEIGTYEWTEETLPATLKDIAARGPKLVRVVFGEEFSYVTILPSSEKERKSMLNKAQEVIPEELTGNWDFQIEKNAKFPSQIAAIQEPFFKSFISNLEQVDFSLEASEPQSISVARLLPRDNLVLFMTKDEKVLLGAVKDGVVLATHVTSEEHFIPEFERFLSAVEQKCGAKPEILFAGREINPQADFFQRKNIRVETANLDPLLGLGIKKDISGEDWQVMNINPKKTLPASSVKKEKERRFRISSREKILVVAFILIMLLLAGLLLYHFKT